MTHPDDGTTRRRHRLLVGDEEEHDDPELPDEVVDPRTVLAWLLTAVGARRPQRPARADPGSGIAAAPGPARPLVRRRAVRKVGGRLWGWLADRSARLAMVASAASASVVGGRTAASAAVGVELARLLLVVLGVAGALVGLRLPEVSRDQG